MTRTRLAELYHEQGKEPEAQTNAQLATSLLRGFAGKTTTATDLESPFCPPSELAKNERTLAVQGASRLPFCYATATK